ncbi:phosphoribosylanthranilate isomerase [Oceanococcus atlanticus]|uniref:N-(5'-phosphoribosyl)anthranilate isomerase n=1 Tax=Oceanococcus atlanticus TaxID=1317117 RepID=A0A1Y1SCG4_9GAMM|nr:phosphoribosylanthranilate isomerase [Oceanococcus atlanticus]
MNAHSDSVPDRTRVKVCGLTRAEDIEVAIAAGVDSIGLVFCERSPRHLEPQQARSLVRLIPAFVSVTALFLNPEKGLVAEVLDQVQPELLQFHGQEPASFCEAFGRRYIKAIAMGGQDNELAYARQNYPRACGFLLDSHAPGAMGGSGKAFDWRHATAANLPLVLAGGLNPGNVGQAIEQVQPWAVDVSSGVEEAPGLKSAVKIKRFLAAVHAADAYRITREK